jgi:hypothetical protein
MRRRHEGCRLLVPGHDEVDSGATQRFDDVEVFFSRNAEDPLDTLVLQGGDEQVGAFHGPDSSLGSITAHDHACPFFEPERPTANNRYECGAWRALAPIVWQALPKGLQTFDQIDGIWVTEPRCAVAVAIALRESLIALSAARLSGEGQQDGNDHPLPDRFAVQASD